MNTKETTVNALVSGQKFWSSQRNGRRKLRPRSLSGQLMIVMATSVQVIYCTVDKDESGAL